MSEKKQKNADLRLVTFTELPTRHKGGGVGSAWAVIVELRKDGHVTALNQKDINRHKYVLDGDGAIRGVALRLEVSPQGEVKSWDVPRDLRLWQQMHFANADEKSATPAKIKREKTADKTQPVKSLAGDAPAVEHVVQMAVEDIQPCPLNPREVYDDARTQGLADNIRDGGVGIIHALLVRPAPSWEPGTCYEVIAGHRRLAAATMLELKTVPVVVREISDEQALTIMMSENLQRADLSPIEEARGYRRMLELADPAGAKIHTAKSLGAKLGKSAEHIGAVLSLLKLPSGAVKALSEGVIGVSVGRVLARVPGEKMRVTATKQVLAGFGNGPMTLRETEELIGREYVAELRGVPWDKADAKLFPEQMDSECQRIAGGACDGCPFSEAAKGKLRLCTNLECFREKARLHVDTVKRTAASTGALVVDGKHADKYLYHDGTVRKESGMVKLSEAPPASEVNGTKAAPTWGKMLAGKEAKTVVVIDAKGKAHELVERKVALEAAKANGYSDLLDAKAQMATAAASQSGEGRDTAAAARAEADAERARKDDAAKEKAKLEKLTTAAALDALIVAVGIVFSATNYAPGAVNKKLWVAMIELALTHAGSESEALVCLRRKLDKTGSHAEVIRDYAGGLVEKGESQRLPGLFVELLLAGLMKHAGVGCKAFAELAKALDVDVGKIKSAVKAEVSEKQKGAK